MLGRLNKVRLKAAETALADGRVDEAFRLATTPDLAKERRAQKVLSKAGEKLFQRAEEHYQAGRSVEALVDLDKAEFAGVKPKRVGDLRTIVRAAVEDAQRNQQSRRQRIDAAQARLADGSIRAAEQILDRASQGDQGAERLKQRAAERDARAKALFEEVRQYVKDNHLAAAIERFKAARRLHPKDKQVAEWERVLVEKVVASVQASLQQGRINRAFEEARRLSDIGEGRPDKRELLTILDTICTAGSAVKANDYEQARRKILGLQHLLAGAKWLKQVGEQLKQIDELSTQLHGGPLGLVPQYEMGAPRHALLSPGGATSSLAETLATPPRLLGSSLIPEKLLVLVDGSGSYLLIRNSRASIGRAASDQPADIPIISDLAERHADIARVGEDYFLSANREVNVGGQNVRQKLLQNGDKIILGKRAKLTFNLPSRKSVSAVLDLSDSAKMPKDVRRVILFDRLVTIGRNRSSHIIVTTAGEELVLFERDGALWVRHQANGRHEQGIRVEYDKSIELAGVRMVFEPWQTTV